MKKTISLLLAVCILMGMGSFAVAAETPTFAADFASLVEGKALPDALKVLAGSAEVGNGYVDIAQNSIVQINAESAQDFTLEVDFTIVSANEDTRWVSFMYRMTGTGSDPKPYMQMCVRRDASAANGVEIAYKNTGGSWEYNDKAAFSEAISADEKYTAKVIASGENVSQSINGQEVCYTSSALSTDTGGFALQTSSAVLRVYAVRVLEAENIDRQEESDVIRTLYTPQTSMVAAPTVVEVIDSQEKLADLAKAEAPPQAAWFEVLRGNAGVVVNTGKNQPLKVAFTACRNRILPVFEVPDAQSAQALMDYAVQNNESDFLVVSEAADALQVVLEAGLTTVRTGLIVPKDADIAAAARSAHAAGANICVLESATREQTEYLQKRFLSVMLHPGNSTTDSHVRAALDCGANSVVVPVAAEAYGIYASVDADPVFVRRAFVVAHRGMPYVAPENTVEGALEAVKAGADAVECDVYVTKDDQLVVNHNGNISGYTTDSSASRNVEMMTRDELKGYILKSVGKYNNCKFAFLDEFFDALKAYPDVIHVIEIKTSNRDCVRLIKELAEEKGVLDQIVIISFKPQQLVKSREVMPEIGASLLINGPTDPPLEATEAVYQLTQKIRGPLSPDASINSGTVEALRHRGINTNVWTIDSASSMLNQARLGASFITTNTANFSQYMRQAAGALTSDYILSQTTGVPVTRAPEGKIQPPFGLAWWFIPVAGVILVGSVLIAIFFRKKR